MLDVKEAVRLANEHLINLFGQNINDVRLEEVETVKEEVWIDPSVRDMVNLETKNAYWLITLSYVPHNPKSLLLSTERRQYKLFKIDAETGELMSMKIREVA